jgi:hypothetical protein
MQFLIQFDFLSTLMNMKQQNSLIESFHEMWNAFPGMAWLINSKHEILASNQNAQEKGYIPGADATSDATPVAFTAPAK